MQDPINNIVRVTLEALASIIGGIQVLATSSYDEAISLPTDEAVEVALRTQQIIAFETGIVSTADPLGGSYFIETLTNSIQLEAQKYLETIKKEGGMVEAIKKGVVKNQIEESAYLYERMIESNRKIVVGRNKFVSAWTPHCPKLIVDEKDEREQIDRLEAIKQKRGNKRVREALDKLRKAARTGENLIPYILEGVKLYATVGEICKTLKEVYGEYQVSTHIQ
jgi:methylmalonyl-CoA mutase N-terminal domain/subunit